MRRPRHEHGAELLSSHISEVVECANVEGGPPDPMSPATLAKRAHLSTGSAFGAMSCNGTNDDSDVQIEGAVWPLSELTMVKIRLEEQKYDEVTRRVTQWTRRAIFTLGGHEMHYAAVETPEGTDRTGDFIDLVLQATSA